MEKEVKSIVIDMISMIEDMDEEGNVWRGCVESLREEGFEGDEGELYSKVSDKLSKISDMVDKGLI